MHSRKHARMAVVGTVAIVAIVVTFAIIVAAAVAVVVVVTAVAVTMAVAVVTAVTTRVSSAGAAVRSCGPPTSGAKNKLVHELRRERVAICLGGSGVYVVWTALW